MSALLDPEDLLEVLEQAVEEQADLEIEETPEPPLSVRLRSYPRNMRHEYLDRMLAKHPDLLDTRLTALAQTLRDAMVMNA